MQIVKLGLPKEENVVSRTNFIINNIVPVGIRKAPVDNMYFVLFAGTQTYDDSYMYFQIIMKTENGFDEEFMTNSELNISKYMNDSKDIHVQKKLSAYKDLIKNSDNGNNIYGTDFQVKDDIDKPGYYHIIAVKAVDKSHAKIVDAYLTLDNYVKIKLYLDKIVTIPFVKYCHESIFINNNYRDIELVKIEQVRMDYTKTIQMGAVYLYTTHYTMNCGPSTFKFNFMNSLPVEYADRKTLKVPMDIKTFDATYSVYQYVEDIFVDNDYLYIIYNDIKNEVKSYDENGKPVYGKINHMKLLRLDKELSERTNFINKDYIFYKEGLF